MTMTSQSDAWIRVSDKPGTLILHICGELDSTSRAPIETAVMAAIPTAYKVVLDLTELTFCDSTGLSMFLAAHQKAEAEGHPLIFANIPLTIARLLEITALDHVLHLAE
jgi:anti-sigma B factor antagonist